MLQSIVTLLTVVLVLVTVWFLPKCLERWITFGLGLFALIKGVPAESPDTPKNLKNIHNGKRPTLS